MQIGLASGLALAVGLYISFGSIARLFTNDPQVLTVVSSCALVRLLLYQLIVMYTISSLILKLFIQFVCASQPVNALAFIFDGLHYGVSDFDYVAQTTVWEPVPTSFIYRCSFFLLVIDFLILFGFHRLWLG